MKIRLLIATPNSECRMLFHSLLDAAMRMVQLDVEANDVCDLAQLTMRIDARLDDLLLLDWQLAGADTPDRLRGFTTLNRNLRVITLLPLELRQYRQCIWDAGACTSIPMEHMDQEWLSSVLCIMHRAMEREERILKQRIPPHVDH